MSNKTKTGFPSGHFKTNVVYNPLTHKGDYKEFIGIYRNALDDSICDGIITQFDLQAASDEHSVWHEDTQFSEGSLGRYDQAYDLSVLNFLDGINYLEIVKDTIYSYVDEYRSIFTSIGGGLYNTTCKIQKTPPGGGYHVWHDENSNFQDCNRSITWMIYLNTLPDNGGGETEFLYQSVRLKPEKGSLILWPAGYTHPHRGNPPLNEQKYIITGWLHYLPE